MIKDAMSLELQRALEEDEVINQTDSSDELLSAMSRLIIALLKRMEVNVEPEEVEGFETHKLGVRLMPSPQ